MAFSQDFKLKCTGAGAIVQRLAQIERKVARQALRKAVDQATKPILWTARSLVPEDTGLLKKSLGRKIKTYKNGFIVLGIIGPRRGQGSRKKGTYKSFGKTMRRGNRSKESFINPVKYAHLVEFGTRSHSLGKGSSLRKKSQHGSMHPGAKAHPFMRPAFEAEKAKCEELMLTILKAALHAAIKGA